jgi:hypothetical protein
MTGIYIIKREKSSKKKINDDNETEGVSNTLMKI